MKKSILILAVLFISTSIFGGDKYKLISSLPHNESNADSVGNYSCIITINLYPADSIAGGFSKDITVWSNNNQTGYQVDSARSFEITKFMNKINK